MIASEIFGYLSFFLNIIQLMLGPEPLWNVRMKIVDIPLSPIECNHLSELSFNCQLNFHFLSAVHFLCIELDRFLEEMKNRFVFSIRWWHTCPSESVNKSASNSRANLRVECQQIEAIKSLPSALTNSASSADCCPCSLRAGSPASAEAPIAAYCAILPLCNGASGMKTNPLLRPDPIVAARFNGKRSSVLGEVSEPGRSTANSVCAQSPGILERLT